MSSMHPTRRLITFLPGKWTMGLILMGFLLICLVLLRNISIVENIDSMLPDDNSGTAENFRLLSLSPFLSKVLIILERGEHKTPKDMANAAKNIAQAVGPPWFKPMSTDFQQPAPGEAIKHLLNILPAVSSKQDLDRLGGMTSPEEVRPALEEARRELAGLTGLGMKEIIRTDPFRFRILALEKLSHLDLFGIETAQASLAEGIFLSPDEKSVLIVLNPKVTMTDSGGSQVMLDHLAQIIDGSVPDDLNSSILSGHVYSAANAAAIRKDLTVVLTVSLTGILLVFLIFLRSWHGALVYAIPLWAVLAGLVAVMVAGPEVSGITIGFGAVLMGLSVDYGLHVFYALKKSTDPGRALRRIIRPILFCWLTTAGVFSLLLFSSLPGQRQLALFTVAGLSAAMVLALAFLPVFISPDKVVSRNILSSGLKIPATGGRVPVMVVFVGLMLGAVLCWPGVRFDGRLQALSIVPDDLAKAEQLVADSWGDVHDMAMVFSRGSDLDNALSKAGDVFEYISKNLPGQRIISLTPLLAPGSQQQAAIDRWEEFWSVRGPGLKQTMIKQSLDLDFSATAFEPFFEYLAAKPEQVSMDDLRSLGLGDLADMLIFRQGDSTVVMTLVPDSPEILNLFSPDRGVLPLEIRDSNLVSQKLLGQEIATALRADMSRFLVAAGLLVVVLTFMLFRNFRQAVQALVPAVAGLCALVLATVILSIEFNLYSMAATFLVLGLGVDYGIFMASRDQEPEDLGTRKAVLVSGLTTLAGFGALILAGHPALHSIGQTVIIGIAAAIPAALFVVPALGKNYA